MKRTFINLFLFFATTPLWVQLDPEHEMEIGTGAGMTGYLGDFNESLFKDLQPMKTVLARYNFSPYMGLKVSVLLEKMEGSLVNVKTYYPRFTSAPYTFNNSLVDAGSVYKYNFLSYDTGRDYRSIQCLSPYIMIRLGTTYANIKGDNRELVFAANLPIGLSVRYKVNERMNIGLEWALHSSFSDELDGQKDPYSIESSGLFKNTDSYSTLRLMFSYSFMAKYETCHNENEQGKLVSTYYDIDNV